MTFKPQKKIDQINLLLKRAHSSRTNNLPKSIKLAEEALDISREIDNKPLIGKCLNQLSLYYMIISDFEESNKKSYEAISYFKELKDERGIANAKYNIASVHYKTDNYHLGLMYLIDVLKIHKKHKDYHNQSKVEKAVGAIYEYIGDSYNAFKSYKSSIKAARKVGDKNLESNVFNPLSGLVLKNHNKKKIAMDMIIHSIALKQETNDVRGLAFAIYGRAKVYSAIGEYEKAEADFEDAIRIHTEMGENMGLAMALRKLGVIYLKTGLLDKANKTVDKSLKLCLKYDMSMIKIKNYYILYLIAKKQKNDLKALDYLEIYLKEKEAVINTQTLKVIENYELIKEMNVLENEAAIQEEKQKIIEKKNSDEKETIRKKQEFLSIMSHEIRTPLNAITTTVSLLKDQVSEKNKELFDSLQFASGNLITIVNDVLDFTKLDVNKAIIETHNTNFDKLCLSIINLHKSHAANKGLELILKNDIPNTRNYLIDQTKISQILSNLISNAIKFTNSGEIELNTQLIKSNTSNDTIKFSVKDTGEGISKANAPHIFDSFPQIKPITTRKQGGTGLGLAIVKQLVELHGGKMTVKSTLGKGSVFHFTIQFKRVNQNIVSVKNNYTALQGLTALVAEDTPINAMLIKKVLFNWGMNVDHVINGIKAFEAAKNKKYDFILMDIHMPEMNGFEATKQIKSLPNLNSQTPIFAVTADLLAQEHEQHADLFNDLLWKPLEIDKIYSALSLVIKPNTVVSKKPSSLTQSNLEQS